MNIFAWNITFPKDKEFDFEFDFLEIQNNTENKTIFVFGETELTTSEELINMFESKVWELFDFDISISTEDNMEILWEWYDDWVYEVSSFEWADTSYEEILERLWDVEEVICIREGEISAKFGNRIIKVDFIY